MPHSPDRPRQRPNGRVGESQLVPFQVVVVEDAPRTPDDGVGVNVRCVRKLELINEAVPHLNHTLQVVQAKRVSGPQGGHDAATREPPSELVLEVHVVFGMCGDGHDVIVAESELAGRRPTRVVRPVRTHDQGMPQRWVSASVLQDPGHAFSMPILASYSKVPVPPNVKIPADESMDSSFESIVKLGNHSSETGQSYCGN